MEGLGKYLIIRSFGPLLGGYKWGHISKVTIVVTTHAI